MNLQVNRNITTMDVKQAFAQRYAGLKLEFFNKAHGDHEGSPRKDMVEEEVLLSSLNPDMPDEALRVTANMKVSDLESAFEDKLGLHVQVFRKMGHIWIETTRTDHYTLSEQMEMSKESMKG